MKARYALAVVLVGAGAYACSSSNDPTSPAPAGTTLAPGGTTPAPTSTTGVTTPPVTQTIGAAGGAVNATGVTMTIPAGALPNDTSITITPSAVTPAGYTGLSPLYTFAPDGTAFQKPVTVSFDLANAGTAPTVYWSNTAGGYDELATTVGGSGVTAAISFLGRGFVAEKLQDAPDAGEDGATPDAGPLDGGPAPDAGASGITATIDGVVTTFAANQVVTTGAMTTIRADDNASSTHWTFQVTMTGIPQEACQLNGFPSMLYTHYTGGTLDATYSSKATGGACILLLSKKPTAAGDHATGQIMSATLGELSGPSSPTTHTFASGTFDLIYAP